jgi:hypothetical protein
MSEPQAPAVETTQAPQNWESSLEARASALTAKLARGELSPLDVSPRGEPEDASDDAPLTPTKPDSPAAKKPKVPLPRGLGGDDEEVAAADADESGAEEAKTPELTRMLSAERDLRRKSRAQQQERQQFDTERRAFVAQQQQLAEQQKQVQQLLQRFSTPEGILEHFESLGEPGGAKIAQYIVEAQDPAKKAAWEAKKSLTPIEQKLQEMQQRLDSMTKEREYHQAVTAFTGYVGDVTESYADKLPYVAHVFKTDQNYLVQRANQVADELHSRRNPYDEPLQHEDIVVELEKRLAHEARYYARHEPNGRTVESVDDVDDEPVQPKMPLRAKAPAKPLTNRAAGGRTMAAKETVEQALASMSLDERVAAAERRRAGRQT